MDVGFVGLGDQGAPIAERIAGAGFPLHLWARRAQSLAPFASTAEVSADLRALGAACDLVGVCVRGDDDVREVVLGDGNGILAGMRAGGVIAVHSTVLPATVVELAEVARERGVDVLDAPVSGGNRGAREGTLSILVGGGAEAFARAKPVFDAYGQMVLLLGPVGSGQTIKLINNNLVFAHMGLGLAALDIAEQLGMDRDVAASVIRNSSGASRGFDFLLDLIERYGGMRPNSNMPKDHAHFVELLAEHGISRNLLLDTATAATPIVEGYRRPSGAPISEGSDQTQGG